VNLLTKDVLDQARAILWSAEDSDPRSVDRYAHRFICHCVIDTKSYPETIGVNGEIHDLLRKHAVSIAGDLHHKGVDHCDGKNFVYEQNLRFDFLSLLILSEFE